MALITQLVIVLLILIGVQSDFVVVLPFTLEDTYYANFPTTRESGFLFNPNSDGCRALDPPPSSGNWFVILANYSECPLDKIQYAKEVDYKVLITYDEDREITEEVRNEGYPIMVLTRQRGIELKSYAVIDHGGYYVTITPETSKLRVEVSTDIPEYNADIRFSPSFITLFTCLVAASIISAIA